MCGVFGGLQESGAADLDLAADEIWEDDGEFVADGVDQQSRVRQSLGDLWACGEHLWVMVNRVRVFGGGSRQAELRKRAKFHHAGERLCYRCGYDLRPMLLESERVTCSECGAEVLRDWWRRRPRAGSKAREAVNGLGWAFGAWALFQSLLWFSASLFSIFTVGLSTLSLPSFWVLPGFGLFLAICAAMFIWITVARANGPRYGSRWRFRRRILILTLGALAGPFMIWVAASLSTATSG